MVPYGHPLSSYFLLFLAVVNDETGENCPPALRLIAVFLLQEITAFMRETFQTIPRTRGQSRPGLHPGWEKLMSHRRWSVLSNTFPAQQQGQSGSVQSIADVAAALHRLFLFNGLLHH